MKQILATITVAVTLIASSALAFDPADLKKLKEANECLGCDLTNANLNLAVLRKANLSEANLSKANLANADLTFATLPVVTRSKAIGCKPKGSNPRLYNYGRGYPL